MIQLFTLVKARVVSQRDRSYVDRASDTLALAFHLKYAVAAHA